MTTLLLRGPESPFEQLLRLTVTSKPSIRFERDYISSDGGRLQVEHQDFRGIVTEEDPALPGETIHAFATNLGPVDRRVQTGEPGPVNPPARVTLSFACYLQQPGGDFRVQGVEVPFAGLTAGAVGAYHIDVTVPHDWPPGPANLICREDQFGDSGQIFVGAFQQ